VDVFQGNNEGLTIAEVELDYIGQPFQMPLWVGPEITGDPRYGNSMLARIPYRTWCVSPGLMELRSGSSNPRLWETGEVLDPTC
jgi:hypothetical protein